MAEGVFYGFIGMSTVAVVGGFASLYYYPRQTMGVLGGHMVARAVVGVDEPFTAELSNPYLPFWAAGGVVGHYLRR